MAAGIYCIKNTKTMKVYVGSSIDIERRKRAHFGALKSGRHHALKLQRSWNLHGPEAFEFSVLQIIDSSDAGQLLEFEQWWINQLDAQSGGYNSAPMAGSNRGMKLSDQTRKRMSEARRGKKRPPLSEDALRNVRIAAQSRRGKPLSPEHNAKAIAGRIGGKRSVATKERMSAARKAYFRLLEKNGRQYEICNI